MRENSDCMLKPGDTHSYGETCDQDERKLRIRRSVGFSSATERSIPWRVDGQSHGETCRNQRGIRGCGPFRIWNWEWRKCKPVAYKTATEKPYASSESDCQGGPKAEKTEWSQKLHVSPATVHHMEAVFSIVRENMTTPWMIWTWIWLFGAYFWMLLFEQQFFWGKTAKFTLREELSLEQCGTVIQWNWKIDQWTKRNHRCKHQRLPRCYVDVDKLIVWKGLSNHQRRSLRLLRLCALCEKNGRWFYCDLEEQN